MKNYTVMGKSKIPKQTQHAANGQKKNLLATLLIKDGQDLRGVIMATKGSNRWELLEKGEVQTVLIGATVEQAKSFRDEMFPNATLRLTKSKGNICKRYTPKRMC